MMETHKALFDEFRLIHSKYMSDPDTHQIEFNKKGQPIMEIIRDYEKRLCAHSEGSGYGKFSSSLADKFWKEVRLIFPKIDFIGVM